MPRPLTALSVLFLAALTAPLRAAPEDDLKFRDKSLAQWLTILEGSEQAGQRRLSLHALGAAADHSIVWRRATDYRKAALLIVETVFGPAKSKKVLPALVNVLERDPEEALRTTAAHALGRISSKCKAEKQDFVPGRDALIGALRDPSGPVREAAATAIGKLEAADSLRAVQGVTKLLKDPYPSARTAAADTLFRVGRDAIDAIPALLEAVADDKNERTMRVQAAQTLGKIGPPEATMTLSGLQKILADDKVEPEVRMAIIDVLSKFGKDASPAVALLAKLMTDEGSTSEMRSAAVTALEQLGPISGTPEAIAALKKAAKDRDKFVRSMALRTFAKLGPILVKELGANVKDVVVLIRQGTEDLLEVRIAAVETLGNLDAEVWNSDTKEGILRLSQLSGGGEKEVREAAVISHKKVIELLLKRAAGEMGTAKPSQLVAIKLFGELGADALGDELGKLVRVQLDTLTKSTDKEVSEAAAASLKKLGS